MLESDAQTMPLIHCLGNGHSCGLMNDNRSKRFCRGHLRATGYFRRFARDAGHHFRGVLASASPRQGRRRPESWRGCVQCVCGLTANGTCYVFSSCEQVLFVYVYTLIPPCLTDQRNFITVLIVTREPEQTTLLFWSAACGVTLHGLYTADRR